MHALDELHSIIVSGEAWLTQRVIHYAKKRGYTPYTSTLEEAWRASVNGLSEPLLLSLAERRSLSAVNAEADYSRDPIAFYGIEAARRHRTRGITLGLFLGLMKGYRQAYLDLVAETGVNAARREEWSELIANFFDRMEVGFCDEWSTRPADLQLDQLRTQNRLIINEKNKYLTIFESLNDPVFLLGETGAVENMNHAAVALFGLTKLPGAGYYGKEQVNLADLIGFNAAQDKEPAQEREIDTRLGRRCFDIRTQTMLDVSEKYLGTVVILVDITEHRKAKTEAEAANRAKSSFLAAMSHEIRTPIHGILGLTDLLAQKPLDAESRHWLDAIGRSGELLSSIVSDILDYSKIEAGVFETERVTFSVASVIEDVANIMRPFAARKPALVLEIDMDDPPLLAGDPAKVKQILVNLIGNAIKFTERGTIQLSVAAREIVADRCLVSFVVTDTGIGIAPDRLQAIFEPFTQSDSSITRRYGGTGLGLAVCKALVERLGGQLAATSILGEGSTFTFAIPFDLAESTTSHMAIGGTGWDTCSPALDILVVEDNEVNALVARGLLDRIGHRSEIAENGASALARIREQTFNLILMDLRLPDMDGREVTRRIRAAEGATSPRIPIVALSAQILKEDVASCLEAGIDDFLAKPFRAEQLDAVLRRLRNHAARTHLGVSFGEQRQQTSDPAPNLIQGSVLDDHVRSLGLQQAEGIVAAWQRSATNMERSLKAARRDADWSRVAQIAHSLKGASRHVGLVALTDAAAALERTARKDAALAAADVEALERLLSQSNAALDSAWAERTGT